MQTPNLDALAGEGAVFDKAFAPAATCVSSRAAFYTGLYPHNSGIYGFQPSTGSLHWLPRLSEQGYHCVSIGKRHLPPTGFDEYLAEHDNKCSLKIRGEDCDWIKAVRAAGYESPFDLHDTDPDFYDNLGAIVWPLPEELHPDIYMADRALEWLDAWDGAPRSICTSGFSAPTISTIRRSASSTSTTTRTFPCRRSRQRNGRGSRMSCSPSIAGWRQHTGRR